MIVDHWARFYIENQISFTTYVAFGEDSWFLIPSCSTVIREPRSDHNANRIYTNASLSSKPRLRVFIKQVRHSSLPILFLTQCGHSRV